MTRETRNVPVEALRFEAGPCEFGAPGEGSGNVPVRITARSGQPIDHWYWGKIVHDLAGMRLHKKTLPIDYAHWSDEVLGYLDRFETESGDLVVAGELVPYGESDRASEVIHKAQHKVPYEASIFFAGPLKLEELSEGTDAKVNGYTIQGPALIVRQWNLRGVAICPYGADRHTKTQLTAGDQVPVTILSEEKTMADQTPATPPAPDANPNQLAEGAAQEPKTTPPPLPATQSGGAPPPAAPLAAGEQAAAKPAAQPDPRAECKRFIDAFGAEHGGRWFGEGLAFEEAKDRYIEQLKADKQAAAQKLAAVDRGEETPLSAKPEDGKAAGSQQLADNVGGGLAALAAFNASKLHQR